jgi:pimeloyl-ACP methyl ester carboxylesterase
MDSASASAERRQRFENETMLSTNVPSDLYWRVTASSYTVNVLLEVGIKMGCLRPSIGYETVIATSLIMALNSYSSANASSFSACNNQLRIPTPFGTEITNIQAVPIGNFSLDTGAPCIASLKSEFSGLNFCNVTVEYTHPGYNDRITVVVLLPQEHQWNGNFVGTGGSGWAASAGDPLSVPMVDAGYAMALTDGGVPLGGDTARDWALLGLGNPDINRFNTFSSKALHEMAVIGKSVTANYYGQQANYNYWVGCSQGGRQGMMNAQRYPEDYDGIAALAPAINWGQLITSMNWPHQVMHELDYYPPPCELLAYTAAAVRACDEVDGLADGIVSSTACAFNPFGLVGQSFDCNGTNATFTADGAKIAQAAWQGPRSSSNESLWYGYHPDAPIAPTVASTTCSATGNCTNKPYPLPEDWFTLWMAGDPSFDLSNVTRNEFETLSKEGVQRYDSIIGTRDPDLSAFRKSGGKMITWHGMADELIPFSGSTDYYDRVRELDESVDDYFRLFLAPGTLHCSPGAGPFPSHVLEDLVSWVEEGIAPTQLVALDVTELDPATGELANGDATLRGRPLCLYPLVQRYIGGDPGLQSSFECVKE